MLNLRLSAQFKRDQRLCVKRGCNMNLLLDALNTLRASSPLPPRNRAHALTGNWAGFQECHLAPDWLLIYRVVGNELQVARTGTHADLFGK